MASDSHFNIMAFLPYLLNQAAEQTSREFQNEYRKKYGMLRTEWRVLFHLGRFGEMSANDVVNAAGIHKTKISRAVQALENKKFLKRKQNDADRRSEQLFLTKSGKSAFETLSKAAEKYERTLAEEFTKSELESLKRLLNKIRERKV